MGLDHFDTNDPYNLLVTSSTEEYEDFPIYFENELPKWLKGTLVSITSIVFLKETKTDTSLSLSLSLSLSIYLSIYLSSVSQFWNKIIGR